MAKENNTLSTKTRLKQEQRGITWLLLVTIFIVLFGFLVLTLQKEHQNAHTASRLLHSPPKLVLDAGHGGFDGGAIGSSGSVEAEVNLEMTLQLRDTLSLFGADLTLTRETASGLEDPSSTSIRQKKRTDMQRRLALANQPNSVFLSIHQNASPYLSACGSVVYYSKAHPGSELLAESIQQNVIAHLQPNNKRTIVGSGSNLYLLHKATWPAVLVECGFLSNKKEEELLLSKDYQKKLSLCIVAGLSDCWVEIFSPTGQTTTSTNS